MFRSLLTILGIAICTDANACYLPTSALHMPPSRLVHETPVIIRAKVISANEGGAVEYAKQPGSYRFQVTEVIQGTSMTTTDLPGDLDPSGMWDTNFSDHKDSSFWANNAGRLGNIGDCTTLSPADFTVGQTYLLFLGGPADSKIYERVDSEDDLWLTSVRTLSRTNDRE